jgi:phenylacetate-CoA ligase
VAFTHNLVEVVGPGALEPIWEKPGEIVVTTLSEPYFPLIRYQIGDIGVMTRQECTCGRNGAKLGSIQGRSNDVIVKPDGGRIHGLRFTPVFWGFDKVRQFLVIQRTIDHIEIELVLSEPLTSDEESRIISEFRSQVGDNVRLEVKNVDHIAPLPSGKRAFVVSNVVEDHRQ